MGWNTELDPYRGGIVDAAWVWTKFGSYPGFAIAP